MVYAVLIFIAAAVGIDQVLKLIVVNTLEIGQSVPLIEGVFHFTYIRNFGAAFSILQNRQIFLIVITGAVMAAAAVILFRNIKGMSRLSSFSLAAVIAGGIGNIIDRIRLGYVVDFLDFKLIDFPVFNFADCCVVVGAFALVAAVFISEKKDREKN
ncbi:MAG: signal peptidase II [Bacillota bacterium]|nr:signal peptidase II [Bacillota bacterium]